MAITTGGGVAYDAGQAMRSGSAQMNQAVQGMVASEQLNRQQALAQGESLFKQLMETAKAANPNNPQIFLGSAAGASMMADIQTAMSRATGKKLSAQEAMQGAYMAGQQQIAKNPSIAAEAEERIRQNLPEFGNSPQAPGKAAEVAATPVAPKTAVPAVDRTYHTANRPDELIGANVSRPKTELGSLINTIKNLTAEYAKNPTPENKELLDEYKILAEEAGANSLELTNPAILEISTRSPSLSYDDVLLQAAKDYPQWFKGGSYVGPGSKYDSGKDGSKTTAPVLTPAELDAKRKADKEALLDGQSAAPRTNWAQVGEDMSLTEWGTPEPPAVIPGTLRTQQSGSIFSGTPLPNTPNKPAASGGATEMRSRSNDDAIARQNTAIQKVASGITPENVSSGIEATAPKIQKLAADVTSKATNFRDFVASKLRDNPLRAASDNKKAPVVMDIGDKLFGAIEKLKSGQPLSRQEQLNALIAQRDAKGIVDDVAATAGTAQGRALRDKYIDFYENASTEMLLAAGLGTAAASSLSKELANIQANSSMYRSQAEAGSKQAAAIFEMQAKAAEGFGKFIEVAVNAAKSQGVPLLTLLEKNETFTKPMSMYLSMMGMEPSEIKFVAENPTVWQSLGNFFTGKKPQMEGTKIVPAGGQVRDTSALKKVADSLVK